MRKEVCASWDLGKRTWGGRERGFGTVPVCVRIQESEYDQDSKESKSSCDGCWVSKFRIICVNTNGKTTLSEAQGVSLRITSGMRGVGLRVADSDTGNLPEVDFMPLETIQRSYSVIRESILFELEGETFEPERKWGGRGVKEKNLNRNKTNTTSSIGLCMESDGTMNEDTPFVVASIVKEVITSSVIDMTAKKEKKSSLEDTTGLEPFPPLSTQGTTMAGNAPGKSSYDNVMDKPSRNKLNFHTLFTPRGKQVAYPVVANYVRNTWGLDAMLENGLWFIRNNPLIMKKWHPDENLLKKDVSTVSVWVKLHGVPVTAFSEDDLSDIATKPGTLLMLNSYTSDMCMQSLGRLSYARAMIELRADVS
nr:hypothetical protein [Tanacetum cinerariifolium]